MTENSNNNNNNNSNIKNNLIQLNQINIEESKVLYENMTEEEKQKYDLLIRNLPILQDKINRDKTSYKEEFYKILKIFKEQFEILLLFPNKNIKNFKELLLFFSHISNSFPNELEFIRRDLPQIISDNYLIIPHEMRLSIVDSLNLLQKKNLLSPLITIPLFFNLIKCNDKILRKKVTDFIISNLKNINENHKNSEINKKIQNLCEKLLRDSNQKLARKTLNIMIILYKKKIWNDSRLINCIANAITIKDIKMANAICLFFLSDFDTEEISTSSEEELDELKNKYKLLGKANNRKTKARKSKLKQLMKSIERRENRKNKNKNINKDFMPIDLIHDPLKFCQELYKKVNSFQTGNFNYKIVCIRLLGRILGRHKLIMDNYFNLMINFMKSDQKDIESILASLAEACHDLIPPTEIEPIIKKLFDNFINDTFPPNYITIGLKTLMEITERCPYCLNDGEFSVVNDLRGFKNKSVSNAARAIVNLYKERKENNENFDYGNNKIDYGIEGIELLKKLEKKPKDYKMEEEEILDEKQLKKLKALKIKYAAELIQHKKVGVTDDDINEMAGDKKSIHKKYEEDENEEENEEEEGELEEIEDEEGELEEIEDEENEEEEDEKEENKKENNKKSIELDENEEEEDFELEEISSNESEEIELDSSEIENESSSYDRDEAQGFIDPDKLKEYHLTRKEKFEKIRANKEEKEKYVHQRKEKGGGTTNKEKEKNKPFMMVIGKKRLRSKINSDKIESMKKKKRALKQQLGRFKRGNMIVKKKGGITKKGKKKKK